MPKYAVFAVDGDVTRNSRLCAHGTAAEMLEFTAKFVGQLRRSKLKWQVITAKWDTTMRMWVTLDPGGQEYVPVFTKEGRYSHHHMFGQETQP